MGNTLCLLVLKYEKLIIDGNYNNLIFLNQKIKKYQKILLNGKSQSKTILRWSQKKIRISSILKNLF